jgi:hypothetical protein
MVEHWRLAGITGDECRAWVLASTALACRWHLVALGSSIETIESYYNRYHLYYALHTTVIHSRD